MNLVDLSRHALLEIILIIAIIAIILAAGASWFAIGQALSPIVHHHPHRPADQPYG